MHGMVNFLASSRAGRRARGTVVLATRDARSGPRGQAGYNRATIGQTEQTNLVFTHAVRAAALSPPVLVVRARKGSSQSNNANVMQCRLSG